MRLKLPRRKFLRLAASATALPVLPRPASALDYPTRPVRIVVGYAAGGLADIVSRLIGQWLSQHLDQPFVIENRPGAAANIATEAVVNSPPDGYTLLMIGSNNAINATLYNNLNFDFMRDIAPIAGIVRAPLVMEVNPSVPTKTVSEFITYAKANPGKINMASGGNGSTPHVAGELFKMMAGVNIVHVPYRGMGAAFSDLLGGQVQIAFDYTVSSIAYIRAGKLRPLGVTTATRTDILPEVPPIGDFVRDYEAIGWTGVGAPRNTPPDVVDKLNKQINAALADPKIQARLADLGGMVLLGSPVEFGKFIADETEKWGKVIRTANIKPE